MLRIGLCKVVAATLLAGAWALPVQAGLIVNGGFEQPTTGSFLTIPAGSSDLTGWTVVSGTVDVVNSSFYPAFAGNQSLDLDGTSAGAIEQSFNTTIGATYNFAFVYANNALGGTNPASANVSLSGMGTSDLLDQDITHGGSTVSDMNYILFNFSFTANSATTTLRFTSLDPSGSNGGIALDLVSVTPNAVPEPSSLCLAGLGILCIAGRALRRRGA